MDRVIGRAGMVLLLALIFAAPAAGSHVQCGDTITQDTTLDSDLTCSADGLTIAAPDVSLDLNGHTIRGSGSAGIGVSVAADRAGIQNGVIRGFVRGVDTDGPRGTSLRAMVLEHNGAGLHCQYAPECLVEDSVVRHNGAGIRIRAADGGDPEPTIVRRNTIRRNGEGVTITGEAGIVENNRIQHNAGVGIANDYGRPVAIRGNVISDNGADGVNVYFGAEATIVENKVARNAGNGVAVYGAGASYEHTIATVQSNRVERNGADGILVENWEVTATVRRNDTHHNGDDGIDVDFGPFAPDPDCCFDVTVGDNKANFNADLGIEAAQGTSQGTTDGGGNRARRNGNPAQCVGVACS